jgi:large subunit ribosomal protein L35
MPKLRTHRGAKKRFNVTGTGKLMRSKGNKSHLRRRRAARARGLYDEMLPVHSSDRARIKRLLPYGVK